MKKSIVIPILNNEYKAVVCWGDLKYLRKLMRDWGYEEPAEQNDLDERRGVCFSHKDCAPIIALPRYPKTAEEIGTLAHEAFHAVDHIFDKIRAYKSDEVFAHSVGAIVRQVLELKERKK